MAKTNPGKPKTIVRKKLELNPDNEKLAHEVIPREIIGGRTGKRFEYQYERASNACLELLESNNISSIFCEWHDDFVIEKKGNTTAKVLYSFNQVKTRELTLGPWSIWDSFSINKNKVTDLKAIKKSFVLKLFQHFVDFGKTCENIIIVTNNTIDQEFQLFLADIYQTSIWEKLAPETKAIFETIYSSYEQAFENLSKEDLLSFLKRMHINSNESSIEKSEYIFRTELADKIHKFSEIDLTRNEAFDIMKDLVNLVRQKSQHKIISILDGSKLRDAKAVQIHEVLKLLSLSKIGYEALLRGDQSNTILQLSRLQKFLKTAKPDISETTIGKFCELKTSWESWFRKLRHEDISSMDIQALRSECFDLNSSWIKGNSNFTSISMSCELIASKYQKCFHDSEALNKDLVFGCMLSLAVED